MSKAELQNRDKERRRFPRQSRKLELKFLHQGNYKDGLVQNLSLGGLLLRTKSHLLINSPVQFVFDFGITRRRCVLHGKVVRVNEDPGGLWPEVGCSFDFSSKESIRLLNEYLKEQENMFVSGSDDSSRSSKKRFPFKDPRIPSWWTNPQATITQIKRDMNRKKKSLVARLRELLQKKAVN